MKTNKSVEGNKFKIMEEVFFGGKRPVLNNLSLEKAKSLAKLYDMQADVYTQYYVLPENVSSDLIYDTDKRVEIYT